MTTSRYYALLGFLLNISGDTGTTGGVKVICYALAVMCFISALACAIVEHYEKDKK